MKKLLIATPVKASIPVDYMTWVLDCVGAGYGIPGYSVTVRFSTGTAVNIARNELAHAMLTQGYDEILFIDGDMKPTTEQLARIVSHDVDIVNGAYCRRKPGIPEWTFTPKPNADLNADMWEVAAAGCGFMRVKRHVFEKIQAMFPEREYFDPIKRGSEDGRTMFEFFPMGVIGPRTADSRLARIKRILTDTEGIGWRDDRNKQAIDAIQDAAFGEQPHGTFYGEDYHFCWLAMKAGFKIWVDMGMPPVGHVGNIVYPIGEDAVGIRPNASMEHVPAVLPE